MESQPSANKKVIWIMLGLGIWLTCLLAIASWYQANYIRSFTEPSPQFLKADFSEQWLKGLLPHLPSKTTSGRVIQFWQPDCLCNRFALPHSIKGIQAAHEQGYKHITLIPKRFESQKRQLQALNPKTEILTLDQSIMPIWPASPSVIIEGPINQLLYIGPLGFGAFCSQSSSSVIEQQLTKLKDPEIKPFFNVIGKGCFCPWQ